MASNQGFPSVLLIDGDSRRPAVVRAVLEAAGHHVAMASDARVAARIVRDERVDLVLIDTGLSAMEVVPRWELRRTDPSPAPLLLPVGDVYAVLRALAADPSLGRFPIVYFTEGVGRPEERSTAFRFAVVGYVPKYAPAEKLRQKLKEALRDSAPQPADAEVTATGQLPAPAFESIPEALRTALVVDGDAQFRKYIKDLLEPHSFKLHEAADGEEGLRIALERRPWLILTDVNMQGIDGFEFCRRVRHHSLLRRTPLIFLSGWDDYRERYHGLKLGADDYLSKSTPPRELLIRLQLTLKRYTDVGTRTRKGSGMEGGIELIGAPGLLQMCHLGQFSGICTVRSSTSQVQIRLRDGEIVGAETARSRGAQAVYEFLSWSRGHFEFVPGDPGPGARLPESFDYLLLEGCRRLDEQQHGDEVAAENRR